MVVHEKLSPKKQERDAGLSRHTRKDTGIKEIQIPYTMVSEYEQAEEAIRVGEQHSVRETSHGWEHDTGIVLQRQNDQPAVIQRQFNTCWFDIGIYLKQICKIIGRNWNKMKSEELYRDILQRWENGEYASIDGRDSARLDILMNLCQHFVSQTNPDTGEFDHYLLLEGNTQPQNNAILESEKEELLAAIDCKSLSEEEGAGTVPEALKKAEEEAKTKEEEGADNSEEETSGVLWIESFVGMQKGKGSILLREVLNAREESIVALGVYPGTENHYSGLGFLPLEGYYSGEDKACAMNSDMAADFMIKTIKNMNEDEFTGLFEFGNNSITEVLEEFRKGLKNDSQGMEEIKKEALIELGTKIYKLYPVYAGRKEMISEKINK